MEIAVEQAASSAMPSMPHEDSVSASWGSAGGGRSCNAAWMCASVDAAPRSASSEGPASRSNTTPVRPSTSTIPCTPGQGAPAAWMARVRSNSTAASASNRGTNNFTTVPAVHPYTSLEAPRPMSSPSGMPTTVKGIDSDVGSGTKVTSTLPTGHVRVPRGINRPAASSTAGTQHWSRTAGLACRSTNDVGIVCLRRCAQRLAVGLALDETEVSSGQADG